MTLRSELCRQETKNLINWLHPPPSLQLCGVALIVVGVLAQFALHNTYRIKDASASGVPIVIIGVGVVIFFIAFFGCCGAWKENYCMITTVLDTDHRTLGKSCCWHQ